LTGQKVPNVRKWTKGNIPSIQLPERAAPEDEDPDVEEIEQPLPAAVSESFDHLPLAERERAEHVSIQQRMYLPFAMAR
jgi:hypothetical protein